MILSFLIVLGMFLGIVLLMWGIFPTVPAVNRVVIRSFWCRFRTRNVSAEFQEDPWTGRPLDVSYCTAFQPSSAITCDKDCLRLRKLDPVRDAETDAERVAVETLIEVPR